MKPSIAFERNRALVRQVVGRYRITNPRLFGSVLHGTDRDGSDIDILVDILPGASLGDLIGPEEDLTALLGVPVNIKTPNELSKYFRSDVLAEAEPV
jgi:predicted nucleotidyltransferase